MSFKTSSSLIVCFCREACLVGLSLPLGVTKYAIRSLDTWTCFSAFDLKCQMVVQSLQPNLPSFISSRLYCSVNIMVVCHSNNVEAQDYLFLPSMNMMASLQWLVFQHIQIGFLWLRQFIMTFVPIITFCICFQLLHIKKHTIPIWRFREQNLKNNCTCVSKIHANTLRVTVKSSINDFFV